MVGKKTLIRLSLGALFLLSVTAPLYAQGKLSPCEPGPDMVKNPCTVTNIKPFVKADIMWFLFVGLIMVYPIRLMIAIANDWKDSQGGNSANFFVKLKQRSAQFVVGVILLLVAIYSGSIFKELQVNSVYQQFNIFSLLPVEHAYAQGVPAFMPGDPMDILLLFLQVLWKWLVFPIVIGAWFWAGFKYVAAQGSGEKIKEAHTVLLTVAVLTGTLIMIQGFVYAVKESIPNPSQSTAPQEKAKL